MTNEQFWLEVAKLGVSSVITAAAAFFAVKISASQRDIARQQAATAKESRAIADAKLNFDLFEERYNLFLRVWEYLSVAPKMGEDVKIQTNFTNEIPKSRFLFGNDIANFMDEAFKRRAVLIIAYQTYNANLDLEASKQIGEQTKWFFEAASSCHKKFSLYLDFSQWQAQPWALVRMKP